MKKLLLLLASGSIAYSASAQQRVIDFSNAPIGTIDYATVKNAKGDLNKRSTVPGMAHKTTADPRWYSYSSYLDVHETFLGGTVAYSLPYLWGNNSVLHTFSGPTYDTANLVSYGIVLDPAYGSTFNGFNDPEYYTGLMKITPTNAFTVDSIEFTGAYIVNPAQTTIDTLRVSFVYGSGAGGSDIYSDNFTITGAPMTAYGASGSNLENQRMNFNASRLTPTGTTLITRDILLNNSTTPPSWAADTVNGVYVGKVAIGASVPANNMIGATISFISGATVPLYDTVFLGSPAVPPVKYNMFRAGVVHKGAAGAATFPTYLAADRNNGVFVDQLTTTFYVPHWFWSSGASAATVQYPDIYFKISCAACGVVVPDTKVGSVTTVTKVAAFPNPANDVVSVPFTLTKEANVTVTLSNVLGQVIATQNMGNTAKGTATFNTSSFAPGIYSYTVNADGQKTTGRVVLAH